MQNISKCTLTTRWKMCCALGIDWWVMAGRVLLGSVWSTWKLPESPENFLLVSDTPTASLPHGGPSTGTPTDAGEGYSWQVCSFLIEWREDYETHSGILYKEEGVSVGSCQSPVSNHCWNTLGRKKNADPSCSPRNNFLFNCYYYPFLIIWFVCVIFEVFI